MDHNPPCAEEVQRAIDRLTELSGSRPRIIEEAGIVRLEITVTPDLVQRWGELLAVLELGSSFGLTTARTGPRAWLCFQAEGRSER